MNFEQALNRVEEELSKLNLVEEPKALYEPIAYTMSSGGKRVRPSLCLMACDALGGDVEKAIYPALGLEIFHNFTLLHDDLMDNDEVRRGRPTVHKKWDANTAILSGDAMQILAYKYIGNAPDKYLKSVLDQFSYTALKVCEGQQYDMEFETQDDVSLEDYMTMIEYKTAVLLEGSMKIGATIAGADQDSIDLFGDFARNLGLAFQLRDDWLDTFGDFKTFGKDIGSDIANNKKTYLLISALQIAEGATKDDLLRFINDGEITKEDKIAGVKSIFIDLGIDELTQRKAEYYYQASITALDKLNISNKEVFVTLAQQLLKRSS